MDPIAKEVENIGIGIRQLRTYIGFSKRFVSAHSGVTAETIGSIEKGKGFNHDSIGKLAYFFHMTISEVTDYQSHAQVSSAIREEVIQYLIQDNRASEEAIKNEIGPKTVIEQWLTESGFFDFPRRVSEVKKHIHATFHLSYRSATVSQALINAKNEGLLKRIPVNKKDFYYLSTKVAHKLEMNL